MKSYAETIAQAFYENFESLASDFGFEFQGISWDRLTENDRNYMLAVVEKLLAQGIIKPDYQGSENPTPWSDPKTNPAEDTKKHVRSMRDKKPDTSLENPEMGHLRDLPYQ